MIGDILQPTHLLFVLVVALLVLGPKRLPEAGRALGNGIRDFRSAINGDEHKPGFMSELTGTSTPPAATTAPPAPTAVAQPPFAEPEPPSSVPEAAVPVTEPATAPVEASEPPAHPTVEPTEQAEQAEPAHTAS